MNFGTTDQTNNIQKCRLHIVVLLIISSIILLFSLLYIQHLRNESGNDEYNRSSIAIEPSFTQNSEEISGGEDPFASEGSYVQFNKDEEPGSSPGTTGSVELINEQPSCSGGTDWCAIFTVDQCEGVQAVANAFLGFYEPTTNPRGLVVLFTGSDGTSFYNSNYSADNMINELRSEGFKIVQVQWKGLGWLESNSGENSGVIKLACRPATIIKYIYDNFYLPMNIENNIIGKCGFCITGNSGGSTQVAYSLAYYNLGGFIDAVIPTAGPPHTDQINGCLNNVRTNDFFHNDNGRKTIDKSWGFAPGKGPCFNSDTSDLSWNDKWEGDSIGFNAPSYNFPNTRIHLIVGENDRTMIAHSSAFLDKLEQSASPYISYDILENVGHKVPETSEGQNAIKQSLLADSGVFRSGTTGEETCNIPAQESVVMQTTIDKESSYRVWSRIMVPDENKNSYKLGINGVKCPVIIGDSSEIEPNTWVWVSYINGDPSNTLDVDLEIGDYTLQAYSRESGVKLDRIMLISDGCIPIDKGDNCSNDNSGGDDGGDNGSSGGGGSVDTTPPNATNLSTELGAMDTIQLTWIESIDDSGTVTYEVFRSKDGSVFSLLNSTNDLTYSDNDLSSGEYCYYIIAMDSSGNMSTKSNTECETPQGMGSDEGSSTTPPSPTIHDSEYRSDKVKISWNMEDYSLTTRFKIYRQVNGSGFVNINIQPVSKDKVFTDKNLPSGNYQYYVVALNDDTGEESKPSNIIEVNL